MKFDNYGDLYFLGTGRLYTAADINPLSNIFTNYSSGSITWGSPLLLSSYKVPNNSYKIQHSSEIETVAEIIDDTDLVTSISNQEQLITDNNKNIYVGLSDSTPSGQSLENIRIKRYNFNPNLDPNLDSNSLDTNSNFFAIDSLTNIEFNSSSNQFQQTSGSSINSKSILIDKDSYNNVYYISNNNKLVQAQLPPFTKSNAAYFDGVSSFGTITMNNLLDSTSTGISISLNFLITGKIDDTDAELTYSQEAKQFALLDCVSNKDILVSVYKNKNHASSPTVYKYKLGVRINKTDPVNIECDFEEDLLISNNWHNLIMTISQNSSDSTMKIYIDGLEKDSKNLGKTITINKYSNFIGTNGDLIGSLSKQTHNFEGFISDVHVFSKVLDAAERTTILRNEELTTNLVSTVNPVIRKLQDNSADIEVTNASKIHVDKQNNLYVTSTSGNDAPNKFKEKRCNHVTKLINRKNYSVSYDNLTPLAGSLSENNRNKTQFRRIPDYSQRST